MPTCAIPHQTIGQYGLFNSHTTAWRDPLKLWHEPHDDGGCWGGVNYYIGIKMKVKCKPDTYKYSIQPRVLLIRTTQSAGEILFQSIIIREWNFTRSIDRLNHHTQQCSIKIPPTPSHHPGNGTGHQHQRHVQAPYWDGLIKIGHSLV